MTDRITRKSLKHDEFVEAAFDFEHWVVQNWKMVSAGVGAVIVVGLVIWGIAGASHAKSERTARDLSEGIAKLLPAPGAEESAASDAASRYAAALPSFEKTAESAAGSPAGRTAAFYRGAALVRLGRAAEAVPVLEALTKQGEDDMVTALARAKLAEALAASQQTDRAVEVWKDLASRTGGYYPPELASYWEADTLFRAGRGAEAKPILEALIAKPGIATDDAKRLLGRIDPASVAAGAQAGAAPNP
jgi:predicted negative regulator of RcsB-dependent stress response